MKPPILLLAVFLLAACPAPQAADKASSPAENPAMPNEAVSIPQMRANAEERLAAYDYHNAAYWAYELKRRGESLPRSAVSWRTRGRCFRAGACFWPLI